MKTAKLIMTIYIETIANTKFSN